MAETTIFSATLPWFTAEGVIGGKPSLFRGRQIPSMFVPDASLPCLFVVSYVYSISDDSGLPSPSQYSDIAAFEVGYIDKLEAMRIGIVAFIKTHDGTVRYFVYVSNVEDASKVFHDIYPRAIHVELAAADDPDWNEYRAFLHGSRRSGT